MSAATAYRVADLPPSSFPLAIEFLDVDSRELVHRIDVDRPGVVVVPPLGGGVAVRLTFGDGTVVETEGPARALDERERRD